MRHATSQEASDVLRNSASTSTSLSCAGKTGAAGSAKSEVRGQGSWLRLVRIDSYLRSGSSLGGWLALCLWHRRRRHCWTSCHSAIDKSVSGTRKTRGAEVQTRGRLASYHGTMGHEGLKEGRLACPSRSDHLAEEHRALCLPFVQVQLLLPSYCAHTRTK